MTPNDPISIEYHSRAGTCPSPEVIAACRAIASDERLFKLIRQLSLERTLRRYSRGSKFLELVRLLVNDPRRNFECCGATAKG
jgi:hypothetical protein